MNDLSSRIEVHLLSHIAERDAQAVLGLLRENGLETGSSLLTISRQYMSQNQVPEAVFLFKLLIQGIESSKEQTQLARVYGDICLRMGYPVEARECYLCIGLNKDMISQVCRTFQDDLDGLVEYLGRCTDSFPEMDLSQEVNELLDAQIQLYWKNEEDRQKRQQLFDENVSLIECHCHPVTAAAVKRLHDYLSMPKVLQIKGVVLESITGKWKIYGPELLAAYRELPHWQLDNKKTRVGISCPDAAVLWGCLASHQAKSQVFYMMGRFVYIDFRVLYASLSAFSFASLFQGDFVFDFMDTRNLRASWQRLFYGSSNMVPTQVILLDKRQDIVEEVIKITAETTVYAKEMLELTKQEIDQYYSDYTFPQGRERARRILFLSTRFSTYVQFSIRDLAWGFEKIGCETLILKENDWEGVDLRQDYIQNAIATFLPDMIFTIDHLRYEFDFYIPESLPFMCWVQDLLPSLLYPLSPVPFGKNDEIFCFADKMGDVLQNLPVYQRKTIHQLPIFINPQIYSVLQDNQKTYDVTFVSHMFAPEETWLSLFYGNIPADLPHETDGDLLRIFLSALEELSLAQISDFLLDTSDDRSRMHGFIQKVCSSNAISFSEELFELFKLHTVEEKRGNHITTLATHIFWLLKMKPVKLLMEQGFDIKVFGKNWDKIPGFAGIARGPVENGAPLNELLSATKINLNMNPGASYHMKVPEIIGSGSFILCRRLPRDYMSVTDYFTEGTEVVFFDDEQDLIKKVTYYLAHEKERETIAENARNRLLQMYTFDKAAEKILRSLAD